MPNAARGLGPSGQRVAANVRQLRQARGLGLAELSTRMSAAGQPVSLGALSKVENGDRRVDADDLVALAVALDVAPSRLLLPTTAGDEPVDLTPATSVSEREAWGWAAGSDPLPDRPGVLNLDRLDRFVTECRPHDPPDRTTLDQVQQWSTEGVLDGLREGYRAALSTGVSPAAARGYLDLLDRMTDVSESNHGDS